MPDINISVSGKRATVEGAPVIICGNSDYTLQLTLDDEWSAATYKTARFVYVKDGQVLHEDRDFTGTTVEVPPLSNIRQVKVGIFAGELYTSTPAVIPCKLSILCGSGEPANPTPEEDARIMELLNKAIEVEASVQGAKKDAETAATKAQAYEIATRNQLNQVKAIVAGNEAYTKYESDQKYAASIIGSASGEVVSIQDSAERGIVNLEAYGKSEQDSTTGKNLLNVPNYTTNASGGYSKLEYNIFNASVGETYIASVYANETLLDNTTCQILWRNTTTLTDANVGTCHSQVPFVATQEIVNASYIQIFTTASMSSKKIKVQIEKGETITTYEPYTNGVSPNPDYPQEIRSTVISEVRSCGKNLFNKDGAYETNSAIDTSGEVIYHATSAWVTYPYISVSAGQYTISGQIVPDNWECAIGIYDVNKNAIGATTLVPYNQSGKSFVVPEGAQYIKCEGYIRDDLDKGTVQIELGSATDYEPYTETVATLSEPITLYGLPTDSDGNFTDENGQQWISDYIDTASGKVVRKVVKDQLTSSRGIVATTTENMFTFDTNVIYDTNTYVGRKLIGHSNRFRIKKAGETFNSVGEAVLRTIADSGWGGRVGITAAFPEDVNTVDLAKKYVDNNETYFIYPLKEPLEEDLPTADVVALKNLKTFYSVTNVTNDSEVKGGVSVEYHVDTKTYIDNKFKELAAAIMASE